MDDKLFEKFKLLRNFCQENDISIISDSPYHTICIIEGFNDDDFKQMFLGYPEGAF